MTHQTGRGSSLSYSSFLPLPRRFGGRATAVLLLFGRSQKTKLEARIVSNKYFQSFPVSVHLFVCFFELAIHFSSPQRKSLRFPCFPLCRCKPHEHPASPIISTLHLRSTNEKQNRYVCPTCVLVCPFVRTQLSAVLSEDRRQR